MNTAQPVLMILADSITNRLSYIVDTLFFGQAILVDDKPIFNHSHHFKIAYTRENVDGANLWIKPHGLLAEKDIQPKKIQTAAWEGLITFFVTDEGFVFDLLAASFYLITRYEEYDKTLPKDEFGRFDHEHAMAYKQEFLHLPLVNCWLKKMQEHTLLPTHFKLPYFSFVPTYDIDIAYSYLHSSIIKNTIGFFKDLMKGSISAIEERIAVLGLQKKDPYDVYNWLDLLHDSLQLQPIYFFLLAKNRNGFDKNMPPQNPAIKKLIKQHNEKYLLGIHPSIQSNAHSLLLKEEIAALQLNCVLPVKKSRQHYIFLEWPTTYRNLLASGISDDYSMGYTNVHGFRASCSFPFKWYDLYDDKATELTIHPFCYMDSTSIFQLSISTAEAGKSIQYYMNVVKEYGGECIMIHHNNFLTDQLAFKDWKLMYADFLIGNFTR